MDMTNYLKNAIRGHVLLGASYTMPAGLYLAIFTTATADDGTGTEAVGGSYARQLVTFTASGTAGLATLTASESFTNMPAGTFSHGAIMDAVSAGNMLLHGALSSSPTLLAGDTLGPFAIGGVTVQFD